MSIKESFNKVKECIINKTKILLFKFRIKFKEFSIRLKGSFWLTTAGDEKMWILLWGWGMFPSVLLFLFFQSRISRLYDVIAIIIYLLIIVYFVWHLYAIRKTLKKHPEYKKLKPKKEEEKYEGMTKEEIKNAKKKERIEKNKERIGKMFLILPWDTIETYKIIICVDLIMILTQMEKILSKF